MPELRMARIRTSTRPLWRLSKRIRSQRSQIGRSVTTSTTRILPDSSDSGQTGSPNERRTNGDSHVFGVGWLLPDGGGCRESGQSAGFEDATICWQELNAALFGGAYPEKRGCARLRGLPKKVSDAAGAVAPAVMRRFRPGRGAPPS